MNDPWDVKCVRQAGQYVSCMRINGVPLLPPVLSNECRTEMQYYKLLAKEVEKRICLLQPFVMQTDSESEDKTDAPELPESELSYELPHEEVQDGFNVNIDKITAINSAKNPEKSVVSPRHAPINDICHNITSNVVMESGSRSSSPKFIIDVSLSINETGKEQLEPVIKSPSFEPIDRSPSYPQIDLPERDYNCTRRNTQKVITEKEVITAVETQRSKSNRTLIEEVTNFSFNPNKNNITDSFADIILSQAGPSSISSKSFTGSLNDLHSESNKELLNPRLIRQSSYTLLNPSPELLAHLEVQSLNTGIEVNAISMSESVSNLSSPNKKRRSWDLETAKVKWSSMALELKQTGVINSLNRNASNKSIRPPPKKSYKVAPLLRSKTVVPEKTKRSIVTPKPMTKSNLISNSGRLPKSEPVAKTGRSVSPKSNKKPEALTLSDASPAKSESEDPAARVRGLYEKIKKQQLLQMNSLMEKQKKEQLLLQQVFEEQNNLLFKQLKTICPKSPIEVKEAWCDKHLKGDRGPVSLSQLINYKSPEHSGFGGPVTCTLIETNNYINQCDNVLKKSRDITGSIKKQPVKTRTQNATKIVSPRTEPEGSRTRTHSPVLRNVPPSRRLNYDTSASSDRDNELMLTDRTNDTMADLNVTFPSDNTEDCNTYDHLTNSTVGHILDKEMKTIHGPTHTSSTTNSRSTDIPIHHMEKTIHNSINNTKFNIKPTGPAERAAATKIVAVAKGYLVRRLMKTDRVQATVQTIKDALLCALQLHQDREGIRGADVDLHRRLIQQITAACYSLHDTFIASTASERCTIIAADRGRRRSLAARQANNSFKQTDV